MRPTKVKWIYVNSITMPKSTRITKCSLCKMTVHNLRTWEKLKNEMAEISSEFIDNQEQIINIKKWRNELNNNYI